MPTQLTGGSVRKAPYLLLILFSLLLAHPATPQSLSSSAQAQIATLIAASHADVGIAFRALDGKSEFFYHGDDNFHAASTMKIPVMIELFHQVRQRQIKLDEGLLIENEFHSIVDGSRFTLDPKDDSEAELYKAVGQTRTVRQLCELMITVSSNFATNLVIQKLGV